MTEKRWGADCPYCGASFEIPGAFEVVVVETNAYRRAHYDPERFGKGLPGIVVDVTGNEPAERDQVIRLTCLACGEYTLPEAAKMDENPTVDHADAYPEVARGKA